MFQMDDQKRFDSDHKIQLYKEERKKCIVWGCGLLLLVPLLFWIVLSTGTDSSFIIGFFSLLIALSFIAGVLFLSCIKTGNKAIEERRWKLQEEFSKEAARQDKLDRKNSLAKEGKLEFSAEKFYNACKEAHITSFKDEFSQTKAEQIINKILSDEGILPENRTFYLSPNNIKKYYSEGRTSAKARENARLEAAKTPRNASPNADEKRFLQRTAEVSRLTGNQKRLKMLQNLENDCQTRIKEIEEGQEALRQLGQIYVGAQKKEASWGLSGGIAEGIAGPAAGLIAASKTIEKNREIQRYNQSMREASSSAFMGSFSLGKDLNKLKSELYEIWNKTREAGSKVTLQNPAADEIFGNLKIGSAKIEKSKTGVLHIELPVSVKAPFELSAPKKTIMVVDGTLSGEIRMGNRVVGSVWITLPLYGIPTNMTEKVTLDAMCERCVEYDGRYTLKLAESQNLWIMEA